MSVQLEKVVTNDSANCWKLPSGQSAAKILHSRIKFNDYPGKVTIIKQR